MYLNMGNFKYIVLTFLFLFLISFTSAELTFGYDSDTNPKVIFEPDTVTTTGNGTTNYYNITQGTDLTNVALTNQTNDFNTFNQTTTGWWNGKFNWIVSFVSDYVFGTFDGETLTVNFNETHLNQTIADYTSNISTITDTNITYYSDGDWIIKNETNGFNFNDSQLSSIYYNATQVTGIVGTIDAGTLTNTQHQDANYDGVTLNFSETSGSPALDFRLNFTDIEDFNRGIIRLYTSSLAGNYPIIQLWSYDDSEWEDYPSVAETETFATITQPVFDSNDHIQDGVVQMRIYKASNGNKNNHYYVDWVAMVKGFGTPSGVEIDPYSIHRDGNTPLTGNWDAGDYNITMGKKLTLGDAEIIEDENGDLHLW